jgi:hypothetical protein
VSGVLAINSVARPIDQSVAPPDLSAGAIVFSIHPIVTPNNPQRNASIATSEINLLPTFAQVRAYGMSKFRG